MKFFKRIQTFLLATIMAVMSIGSTTAFAAEKPIEAKTAFNSVIETDAENTTERSALVTLVHQNFKISGSHTGSSRSYGYSYITFTCLFRDQNGNQLPNGSTILAVRLYDATTGQKVNEWQGSNGVVMSQSIAINTSHRYYFQYVVAYGTANLSLEMLIQGVNI